MEFNKAYRFNTTIMIITVWPYSRCWKSIFFVMIINPTTVQRMLLSKSVPKIVCFIRAFLLDLHQLLVRVVVEYSLYTSLCLVVFHTPVKEKNMCHALVMYVIEGQKMLNFNFLLLSNVKFFFLFFTLKHNTCRKTNCVLPFPFPIGTCFPD